MADTTQVLEHFLASSSVAGGLLLLGGHFNSTKISIIDCMVKIGDCSHGVLGFWGGNQIFCQNFFRLNYKNKRHNS